MSRPKDFKKKGIAFDNHNNHTVGSKVVTHDNSPMTMTKEDRNRVYIIMTEEEIAALPPKERSKAALVRNNFYTKHPDRKPNPNGTNQYTYENQLKKFNGQHQLEVMEALKATLPGVMDTVCKIAADPLVATSSRLKACELLIAYQLAKPVYREKEDKATKTFIILPPDAIVDKDKIIELPVVRSPEEGIKKK